MNKRENMMTGVRFRDRCRLCGADYTPYQSEGAAVAPGGTKLCADCVDRIMERHVPQWEYSAKPREWAKLGTEG